MSEYVLPDTIDKGHARYWLAAEAHVLASHICPDAGSDSRNRAWFAIAAHPLFADCYQTEGVLVDAMLAKLDAAHTHTCEPVWRPVTREEIQAGWEVRSRYHNGSEATWGVAHHRDGDGDWLTQADVALTFVGLRWTYETTAPVVAPKPDPRVGVVLTRSEAALILSIADAAAPNSP